MVFLSLLVCVNVSRPLQVPMIVKALHKQLKEKSVKTRQCCFNMLTELVNVLPGALTQHIPVLIPGDTVVLMSLMHTSSLSVVPTSVTHQVRTHGTCGGFTDLILFLQVSSSL